MRGQESGGGLGGDAGAPRADEGTASDCAGEAPLAGAGAQCEERADEPPADPVPTATQLMPGGVGRPAAEVAPEPCNEQAGEARTLPMPKPGPRPDDDTTPLARGEEPAARQGAGQQATPADDSQVAADDGVLAGRTPPAGDAPSDEPPARVSPAHPDAATQARIRRTVLIACAAALVAIAIAAATYVAELWGGHSVPQVQGLAASDARSALESAGFKVDDQPVPTDEGVGTALYTEPGAGACVKPGYTIELYVGAPRAVPDVAGKQVDDAKNDLANAGITKIRVEYKNSDEDKGTVIGVSPARGTVVKEGDEVTLQVARPYTVPDVTGLSQDDATKEIAEAGLESKIEWRESEGSALQVLSTDPAPGTEVKSGSTVTVSVVAPGPRDETYLPDYLTADPKSLSSYLGWKGWTFRYGKTVQGAGTLSGEGYAETGWTKAGVGTLVLTPVPESSRHGSFLGELLTGDVLAQGAKVAGVRYEPDVAASGTSASVDSATVNSWASRCGLTGIQGVLSGDDVARAMGRSGAVPDVLTGFGESDGNTWSVTVTKAGSVVVTCAPTGLYQDVDLSRYGGSLGVYLAYSVGFDA